MDHKLSTDSTPILFSNGLRSDAYPRPKDTVINEIPITRDKSNTFYLPITIETPKKAMESLVLLDSGAGNNFINSRLTELWKLPTKPLSKPIKVKNVDGTENKLGKITHYVELHITIK